MANKPTLNKVRTIVLDKKEFEAAKYATIIEIDSRRLRRKLPQTLYLLTEDKAMVQGVADTITFRKRFSLKKISRSLQTIIIDNSNRFERRATIYLNENL